MKKQAFFMCLIFLLMPVMMALGNNVIDGEEDKQSDGDKILNLNPVSLSFPVAAALLPAGKSVSYPARGILFSISPNSSQIHNKDVYGDNTWTTKGKFGFNMEIGYFLKVGRLFGIGAGLGYSQYGSEISLDSSYQVIPMFDYDNNELEYNVRTGEVFEEFKVSYIDIPIYLELGNPNIDKIGFYGRLGLKVSFPVGSKISGNGNYSSWGYYPECPVTLEEIPELGYYNDQPIYGSQAEPELKSVMFSLLLSGGVTFPLSNLLILKVGGNINLGLSEISDEKASDGTGASYHDSYSKLLNNSSKTSTKSYGLEIGLIYNLRLY